MHKEAPASCSLLDGSNCYTCLTLQAEISYDYLRGTTDEGNYLHPSKVMINKRKLGPLAVSSEHQKKTEYTDHTRNMQACNCGISDKATCQLSMANCIWRCAAGPGHCWEASQAHFSAEPLAALPRQCLAPFIYILW